MFWLYKYILISGILQEMVMTSHEVPETSKIRLFKRHHSVKVPKRYLFHHNLLFTKHSYKAKLKETKKKLKTGKNNNILPLLSLMINGGPVLPRPTEQSIFFNQQKLIENLGEGQKISNKYLKKIQRLLKKSFKHSILRPHTKRQNCPSDGLFPDLYYCRSYHYCLDGRDYLSWCKDNLVYSHRHKACMKISKSTKCFKFRCKNRFIGVPYDGDANIYALCQRNRPILILKCPDGFIYHKRYQSCLPNCNAVFSNSKGCKKVYKCLAEYQNSPKRFYEKLPQFTSLDLYNLCLKVIFGIDPINRNIISFGSTKPTLIQGKANTTTPKQETSSSTYNTTLAPLDLSSASHRCHQTAKNEHATTKTPKKDKIHLAIIYIHSEGDYDRPQNISNSQNPQISNLNIISAIARDSEVSNMPNPTFSKLSISDPEAMNAKTHMSSDVPTNDDYVREWKTYIKSSLKRVHNYFWIKESKRNIGQETELKYSYNETLNSTPDTNLNDRKLKTELSTTVKNEIPAGYISRPSTLDPEEFSLPPLILSDINGSPLISTTEHYSNIVDSSETLNISELNSTPDTNLNDRKLNTEFSTTIKNEIPPGYISSPSTLDPEEFSLPPRIFSDINGSPLISTTEPYSNIVDSSETLNISELNKSENFVNDITSILPNTQSKTIFLTTALSTEFDHRTEHDTSTESPQGSSTSTYDTNGTYDSPEEEDPRPKSSYLITENSNMTKNNDGNSSENKISLFTKEYVDNLGSEVQKTTSRSHFVDVTNEEMDTETIPLEDENENITNMDLS